MKNPDFVFRNPDFRLKNVDFIIKQAEESGEMVRELDAYTCGTYTRTTANTM